MARACIKHGRARRNFFFCLPERLFVGTFKLLALEIISAGRFSGNFNLPGNILANGAAWRRL